MGSEGGAQSSFSAIANLVAADNRDVNILVIGDSTSNETSEWVYLFFSGAIAPTHSIVYHLWDDVAVAYASPVTLSTGSGAHTIHVWNASVSGARAMFLFGVNFSLPS